MPNENVIDSRETADLDIYRILGRDKHDGPVLQARLNDIGAVKPTHFSKEKENKLTNRINIGIAVLVGVFVLGPVITGFANAVKDKPYQAPAPKLAPVAAPQGTFQALMSRVGTSANPVVATSVSQILSIDPPATQDDISTGYISLTASTPKAPEGWRPFPIAGAAFPGDAMSYKMVTGDDGKPVLFVVSLVRASEFVPTSMWIGVVHQVDGKPVVCNFVPTELTYNPQLLRSADTAKCREPVTEKMIPRAAKAAFDTNSTK